MAERSRSTPPGSNWTQEEWDLVRHAPALMLEPYTPTLDKVTRAHQVLPYVSHKNVRLVDSSLAKPWLDKLLGFPMAAHDDAVDATVAALEPWATQTAEQIGFAQKWKRSKAIGAAYSASNATGVA
jgi:phage terminase large subunit-like protein